MRSRAPQGALRPLALSALGVLVAITPACRRETGFDGVRARAHLDMLAGTIGSRPVGTPANVRARQYVVDQLTTLGFAVRMQEAESVNEAVGLTTRVANVIAVREGARPEAIALVSHFDSVPEAAGAIDAGLGVATCLEAARVLAGQSLSHTLIVLLTDAEEVGLMGARAAVTDPLLRQRLRYFLNFDGTGAAGSSFLYETTGGSAALQAWAFHAPSPSGSSLAIEVYKRMPNDTDFTVLETTGASGLNFGAIGDSYAYHTDRDVAGRVRSETLQRGGDNTVAIVRALDASATDRAPGFAATYFDLAGRQGVVYGPRVATWLSWFSCLVGGVVWLLLTRDLWRRRGLLGLFLAAFWSALALAAAIGAMLAATWWIREARDELNPWYASPHWFFMWLVAFAIAAAGVIGRLRDIVPERARPWRAPEATWWVTLPIWIALTILMQRLTPAASYLAALPLATIAALLAASRKWPGAIRPASFVVAVIVWLLWVTRSAELLGFLVPLFGWLPVVPPVWLFPAVIAGAGMMAAPPVIATVAGAKPLVSRRMATVVILLLTLATGAAASRSPAYTSERPARRAVRYIQDNTRSEAWWEVAGTERPHGLRTAGPIGAMWQESPVLPRTLGWLDPLIPPFKYRTVTIPLVSTPPADVRGSIASDGSGRSSVEIVITSREPLAARIVLPPEILPAASSLAGRVWRGRWNAIYVAVPPEGLSVKMAFDKLPAGALDGTVVVVTVPGLPGGTGPRRLPEWLPQERATWWARSQFILPVVLTSAAKKSP